MSQLAIEILKKAKKEKATFVDLGNCGLTRYLPDELFDDYFIENLEELSLGNVTKNYLGSQMEDRWVKYSFSEINYYKTPNKGNKNIFSNSSLNKISSLLCLSKLWIAYEYNVKGDLESMSFIKGCKNLEEIYIVNNQISKIEGLNEKLQTLRLSGNKISKIEALNLNLKTLDLGKNQINKIEGLNENLLTLNLSWNQISKIEGLNKNLETLELGWNKISKIEGLNENLLTLDLSKNQIGNIEGLNENLKILNLSENQISNIKGLNENLQTLYLGRNQISKIEGLNENLQSLELSENLINKINGLNKNLHTLNLFKNKINKLEGLNENLKILDLRYNKIEKIENLNENLLTLNLGSNQISKIEGLNENLQNLHLSGNQISKIEKLPKNLVRLEIDNNKVSKIENLNSSLQELFLLSNDIEKIEGLNSNLKLLDLTNNQIGKLEGLNPFLEALYIRSNNITVLENLNNNLFFLDISDNRIHTITKLNSAIKILDLRENKIESIVKLIPYLKKKKDPLKLIVSHELIFTTGSLIINLFENPLTTPPMEIVMKGNEAVIRYFEEKKKSKEVHKLESYKSKEIKLIIVGNPNVGKTYLSSFLSSNGKKLPDKSISTHGMIDHSFKYILPNKEEIKVRLLDFGGQEYYHDTHHLFFTNDTAYFLLWDNKTNNFKTNTAIRFSESDKIEKEESFVCYSLPYWLDAIKFFVTKRDDEKERYNILEEERKLEIKESFEGSKLNKSVKKIYTNIENALHPVNRSLRSNELSNIDESNPVNVKPEEKKDNPNKFKNVILVETKRGEGGYSLIDNDEIMKYKDLIHSMVSISMSKDENNKIISKGTNSLKENFEDIVDRLLIGEWPGYNKLIVEFFDNADSVKSKKVLSDTGVDYSKLVIDLEKCRKLFNEIMKSNDIDYVYESVNAKDLCNYLSNRGYILYFDDDNICLFPSKLTERIYKILDIKFHLGGIITKEESKKIIKEVALIELMKKFKLLIEHPNGKDFIIPQNLPDNYNSTIALFMNTFKTPLLCYELTGYIHKNIIQEVFHEFGKDLIKDSVENFIWKNGLVIRIDKEVKEDNEDKKDHELYKIEFSHGDKRRITISQLQHDPDYKSLKEIMGRIDKLLLNREHIKKVSIDGESFVSLKKLNEYSKQNIYQLKEGEKTYRVADFRFWMDDDSKENLMKKLFISYSSEDSEFMKRFLTHLSPYKAKGTIDYWHDRMIEPGSKWDDSIKKNMEESDIVIFLISPDLLATEYVMNDELLKAIELSDQHKCKLFFVQVKDCMWEKTNVGKYQQVLNDNEGKEIESIKYPDNDSSWKLVLKKLEKLLDRKE